MKRCERRKENVVEALSRRPRNVGAVLTSCCLLMFNLGFGGCSVKLDTLRQCLPSSVRQTLEGASGIARRDV